MNPLPQAQREKDQWILSLRTPHQPLDPSRPSGAFIEEERTASGAVADVATLFLTNRECPFRCLMCDLWKNTVPYTVPRGAIAEQIRKGLEGLPPARQVKLYNSGSFFDPNAIPSADYPEIAAELRSMDRVIVECHPAFVGKRSLDFRSHLSAELEVAIGLETAHPGILEKLNKRMTLEQFRRAAEYLQQHNMALRTFILLRPPFLSEEEGLEWAKRSLDYAFECGAAVCTLIPTRTGNGALERLAAEGQFSPPALASLEEGLAYGIRLGRGRVFADLWDLERVASCPFCFQQRAARLRRMNLEQVVPPGIDCQECDGA
ncbi:MAG: radical SAM protein [Armatimonadota bacterium]|nr:radical SAM protein [Armatimonadota bacterium]